MRTRKYEWESEILKQDLDEYGGFAEVQLWPRPDSDDCVYLEIQVSADPAEVEIDYEEEGPATYVPYGEQSVIYDDGSARITSIDSSKAATIEGCTIYSGPIKDPNTRELSKEEAAKFLNCDIDDLVWYIEQIAEDLLIEVRSSLESYAEDRFYDSEDTDWRDVEWDLEESKKPLKEARSVAEIEAELAELQAELEVARVAEKKASYNGNLPKVVYIWDMYLDPADKGNWTSAELDNGIWDGYVFETEEEALAAGYYHLGELDDEGELDGDPDDYYVEAFNVLVSDVDPDTLLASDLEHLI